MLLEAHSEPFTQNSECGLYLTHTLARIVTMDGTLGQCNVNNPKSEVDEPPKTFTLDNVYDWFYDHMKVLCTCGVPRNTRMCIRLPIYALLACVCMHELHDCMYGMSMF